MRSKALMAILLAATSSAFAESTPDVARHFAAGKAAATPDFPGLLSLCQVAPRTTPFAPQPAGAPRLKLPPDTPVAPRQVFDNLYFVGTQGVSAWVVRTSAGLVLIDSLNNEAQARDAIAAGLAKLGLDARRIKYLVITHGHGDHYGGSKYIIDTYHPRVVMSALDWSLVGDPARRLDIDGWGPPPKRDMVAKAPRDTLVLGDTSFTMIATPGHTEGTISLVFPVFDHGRRHMLALWGGTGFNFGPLAERYRAYARSAGTMKREVLDRKVDVLISNHPMRDETLAKFAVMDAHPGAANPFVLTTPRVARAFDALRECATGNALALAGS